MGMTISSFKANPSSQLLLVTDQVFRLKAEGYKTSRKVRIKPFKTFSVSLPAATSAAQAGMNPRWARSPNASTNLVD